MKAKVKKKRTGIKAMAWIVLLILLIGAGGVGGWFARVKFGSKAEADAETGGKAEEPAEVLAVDEFGNSILAKETYAMPRAMQLSAQALDEAQAEGKTVTVKIKAEVTPDNADNKAVDYLTSWGEGAEREAEPVSDYIEVNQEADGSAEADVVCKKAFGADTIYITVKTRDKGFTATCTVTFVGKADKIEITSSTLTTTSSASRGEYYALMTDTEYEFEVTVSNVFDQLGEYNLEVTSGLVCEKFYVTSLDYQGQGSYWTPVRGVASYIQSSSLLKSNFIQSVTLEDKKLKLNTGSKKLAVGYNEENGSPEGYPYGANANRKNMIINAIDYDPDSYDVPEGAPFEGVGEMVYGFDHTYELNYGSMSGVQMSDANKATIEKAYFYIRVKDTVSGVTAELRFFLGQSVTGVKIPENVGILG